MEPIVNIHLHLLKRVNNEPLTGNQYRVKLYDKDFIKDDFLGESDLDKNGHAIVSITSEDFKSIDSFMESYPDIYFVVLENDEIIYKSNVYRNVHAEEADHFPASQGLNFNLGTFVL